MSKLEILALSGVVALLFNACDRESSSMSAEFAMSSSAVVESSSGILAGQTSSSVFFVSSSGVVEEIVPSSSSEEGLPLSSEQSSSSMRSSSSLSPDEIAWGDKIIKKFDGDTSEVQKAGRVWLGVKGDWLRKVVFDSLEMLGIKQLGGGPDQNGVYIYLTKFENDIKKVTLDSLLDDYFNSFNVDDTSKIEVEIRDDDWVDGSLKLGHHLKVYCWEDVSIDDCCDIIEECGGVLKNSFYLLDSASLEMIDCLSTKKDVKSVDVVNLEVI